MDENENEEEIEEEELDDDCPYCLGTGHAMLVKETEHEGLWGHTIIKKKERKSFFRRLAESKGSPPIDYEVVLCIER